MNALDGIYGIMSKGVYLSAYSILRGTERAKDVMQETFLKLAANIGQYRENTNAAAWILTIARNLSYREYRAGKRNVGSEDFDGGAGESDERLWAENIALNDALGRLSAEEREIVTLFAVGGYKYRELARITGRPMGTVQWIYHRAIKKMKRFMEEE